MPRGASPPSRLEKGYSSERPRVENADDKILDSVIEQIRDNWVTIEERRVREWDSYQRLHRRTAVSFGAPPPTPSHFSGGIGGAHAHHGEEADYSYLYDNPDGPNHNTVLRVMIQAEERQRLERAARYGADGVYADDETYGGGLLSSDLALVGGSGGDENHVPPAFGVGHAHAIYNEKVTATGMTSSASSPPLAARDPISFIGLAGNNGPHARAYGQASTGRNQTRVFFDIATIPLTAIASQPTKDNNVRQREQEENKSGGGSAAAKAKTLNMSGNSGSSNVAGLSHTSYLSPFVLDGTIDAKSGLPYVLSQSPPTPSLGGRQQQHPTARSGASTDVPRLSEDSSNDQKNKLPTDHSTSQIALPSSQQSPSSEYPPHTALPDLFSSPEPVGRIVFELYEKACPKAVANFCKLVSGSAGFDGSSGVKLDFAHTSVYSAKRGVELTMGLLNLNSVPATSGSGIPDPSPLLDEDNDNNKDGGEERKRLESGRSASPKCTNTVTSSSSSFINEERLNLRHVERGLLSMKSVGPNRIGSFFSITLGPAPELDFKQVIIGHVVEGHHVLEKIEALIFGSSSTSCTGNKNAAENNSSTCTLKVGTNNDGGGEVDTVNKAAAARANANVVEGGISIGVDANASPLPSCRQEEGNSDYRRDDEANTTVEGEKEEEGGQRDESGSQRQHDCERVDGRAKRTHDCEASSTPNGESEHKYTSTSTASRVSDNKREAEEVGVNSSVVSADADDEHDNKSNRAPPVPIFAPLCGVLAGPTQTPVGIERLAAYLNSAKGTAAIKRALCAAHPHVFARWDEEEEEETNKEELRSEEAKGVSSSCLPTAGSSRQVGTQYVPSPPPLQEGGARRAPRQSGEDRGGAKEDSEDAVSPSPTRSRRSPRRRFRLGPKPTCKEVSEECPPTEETAAADDQHRVRSQSGGRTARKRRTVRAPPVDDGDDEVADPPSSGIPALSVFHIVRKQLPRSQLSVAPSKPMFGNGEQ